jgi:hypothetical protein
MLTATVALLLLIGWRERQRTVAAVKRQEVEQKAQMVMDQARDLLETAWQTDDDKGLAEARAGAEKAVEIAHSGGAGTALQDETMAFQTDARERLIRAEKNRRLRARVQFRPKSCTSGRTRLGFRVWSAAWPM